MLLSELKNKKTGIWGMGREGQSALNFLSAIGKREIVTIDKNMNNENAEVMSECEIIIKSPGISKYSPLKKEAEKKGTVFTTGTNLFISECRRQNPKAKIIGVTGTKGKSTTSSLVFHGLRKLGKNVSFGGNIGKPLLDLLPLDDKTEYVVCEMSSYQCAELQEELDYAVVLNLYKEHLDWHLSHDAYFNDKLNITEHCLTFPIVNGDNDEINARLKDRKVIYFNKKGIFSYHDDAYFMHDTKILEKNDVNVIGDHNRTNFLAVLTLYKELGIDVFSLKNIFDDFKPLPHRLETVGIKDGVIYVDDSISTTPEAAMAAINAFLPKKIILLAGGFDRNQDFLPFVEYLKDKQDKVTVVCMYKTGERLFKQMHGLKAVFADNLAKAVDAVNSLKEKNDVVLLSPASPSYGYFKNFEERGNEFRRLVGC